MIIDIAKEIGAIARGVAEQQTQSGEIVAVTLQRHYSAEVADVWQAITDPDRVRRWFVPLSGDLREGGNFQLEGHAGGDILSCEPPHHLVVTFGGESSIVDLVLSVGEGQTLLQLTHSVPIELAGSGAGALYVGPGWDGALMGIARHLAGRAAVIRSRPPTVLRCRTSMSALSRNGSPLSRHQARPTLRRFRQPGRPHLRSLLQTSYDPTDC